MSSTFEDLTDVPDGFNDTILDASDKQSTEELQGSGYLDKPGKYHVVVREFEFQSRERKTYQKDNEEHEFYAGNQVKLLLDVVAGTEASQIGRSATLFVAIEQNSDDDGETYKPLDGKYYDNLLRLFHSLGLLELGEKTKPRWGALKDAQCVMEATENQKNGRVGIPPWYPSWRLDDPAVAEVPKDPELCLIAGIDLGDEIGDDMSDI